MPLVLKQTKNSSGSHAGQLGKHSAQALVNVNFKNVTEHFGLRGRQEHSSMMVEDFNIITSPDSAVKYVTFKEGPTKTRQGRLRIAHRAVQALARARDAL